MAPTTTTTRLNRETRRALQTAIFDRSTATGFGWVRNNVLRPNGAARLTDLTDDQLCRVAAVAIAPE